MPYSHVRLPLLRTDLTSFVTQAALWEAESAIAKALGLSARDSLLVLNLLAIPLPLNKGLKAAISVLPKRK